MRQDWRRKKFKDQKGACHYCRCDMVLEVKHKFDANRLCTLDHRIPLSRGGMDHWENSVAACVKCNHAKGARTEQEFRNENT